ncbi:serine/threonine protein kinase [Ornithinibacillus halotolerans]|uniref:serine/threonine protein kinase n=1 Tax=Ornithinibacillus halotolerans TaxID=1274357 RepID=UPI001E4B112B|nr:serine/threonine-protein kinase [Ornithinibacillus halotolerans]
MSKFNKDGEVVLAVIGSIIDGKYEILKLIGRGGMSKVYLAMDKRLNKQWAVKEIEKTSREKSSNEVVIQSAIAEANLIKKLDHPALPRIVDIIDREDVIFVIMDYIEGEPLDKIIDEYGAQPQELVIEWAKQLCEVLDYLHTRQPSIIYRDMKPANVMLKPDGNLKLIDFGIAREFKEQNLADTVSLGTKGYAAPEQFGGKGQTDPRTDVYCLGVTLYHLVTGHNPSEPPYELYPIRNWNPNLSGGLEKIILKCTQLNPEDRYQSCAELLYALDHYEEVDDVYREKQKSKLRKFGLVTGAAFICLFAGVFGQGMKVRTDNTDYNRYIQLAERATSEEGKIDYYVNAIDIKPTANEAYMGLIKTFRDDLNFSIEEEQILMKKINPHLSSLRENEDYADLAFEIGKIYWYYYGYGKNELSDNQVTRMKSSVQWFDDVLQHSSVDEDYYEMAAIYQSIGQFNEEINIHVQEASDKGMYMPYWDDLKGLINLVSTNQEENEIVNLELYKLTMFSIETYARKFKSDGVEESDIRAVFEEVKNSTEQLPVTTDKTEEMKNDIMGRISTAEKAIDNAYRQ